MAAGVGTSMVFSCLFFFFFVGGGWRGGFRACGV